MKAEKVLTSCCKCLRGLSKMGREITRRRAVSAQKCDYINLAKNKLGQQFPFVTPGAWEEQDRHPVRSAGANTPDRPHEV